MKIIRQLVLFVFLIVLLISCPATLYVEITNQYSQDIAIIYSTGHESIISPGKTKKELYKSGCLTIKVGAEVIKFKQIQPPEKFYVTGLTSSKMLANFTQEKDFILYINGGESKDSIKLKKRCV